MESVKMKKATKTVAFRQLAIYCNIVDNQLLTDAATYRCSFRQLLSINALQTDGSSAVSV